MTNSEERFSFEDLRVWQNSMDLAEKSYRLIGSFPSQERYGLSEQMRRAVTSVSLNIAEGQGRYSKREYAQFLYNARGSLFETVTCLKLAVKLKYLQEDQGKEAVALAHQVHREINALIKYLKGNRRTDQGS